MIGTRRPDHGDELRTGIGIATHLDTDVRILLVAESGGDTGTRLDDDDVTLLYEPQGDLRSHRHPSLAWAFDWNRNPHSPRDGNCSADVGQVGIPSLLSLTKVRYLVRDDQIAVLRSFNRTVTERLGALQDQYLARPRPLGASRVLWEVDPEGSEARSLRSGLGLDSGYLSRLLRTLESEGMVRVIPDRADHRVRTVTLTSRGLRERETLDQLSDDLAASMLEPLNDRQRSRLIDAAATVERLLTAGLVQIGMEDPTSDDARYCIDQYFVELDDRFDTGFDPSRAISAEAEELTEPAGLLLVARLRHQPVGCGALKLHDDEPAEIKRMWVSPTSRGLGLGRRILSTLESEAKLRGATTLRLETNRSLDEAIALYRSAGYEEVTAFNEEPFAHHWFEKRIG